MGAKADTDFYELIHSPDDEASVGNGWYAITVNSDGSTAEESGLYPTREHARAWARRQGGRRQLAGADQ